MIESWPAADCLFTRDQVEAALDSLAGQLNRDLAEGETLVLGVMNGALVPLGYLLPRLTFKLQLDYAQISRYGAQLRGGEVNWLHRPSRELAGRRVLVVDDILDRGLTLAELVRHCTQAGATQVLTAVLVRKHLASGAAACAADYWVLEVPDRYVFGYGMDCRGYWRNAPGIFALNEESSHG